MPGASANGDDGDSAKVFVTRKTVEKFIVACIEQSGLPRSHGVIEADALLNADSSGKTSHGLQLLDLRLTNIEAGTIINSEPVIKKEGPCSAIVDGCGCLGSVVASFCMDKAIDLANNNGIGWVTTRGSHHLGSLGWYTMKACREGLIGLCMSNTLPALVVPRSKGKSLGTNPLCLAAPALNGDYLLFDSSLTVTAMGKVRESVRDGDGKVPDGWGVDGEGLPTQDASSIYHEGGILPLGGFGESSGGHKGFGLVLLVEVLTSVLVGSAFVTDIGEYQEKDSSWVAANLGQSFIVINPSHFGDGFMERMQQLLDYCRHLDPIDAARPVLIPGDRGRQCNKEAEQTGGVWYSKELIDNLNAIMVKMGGTIFLEDEIKLRIDGKEEK